MCMYVCMMYVCEQAQNEAIKLAEDTVVLKTVTEATDLSKATDEKLQKILKDLNTLVRFQPYTIGFCL